jgi:transcriptional regulator with XRE-family HTH domain
MADYTGDNLRRIMAGLGLSIGQVVEQTGLDRRTVKGILDGTNKAHTQTLHALAEGLGLSIDEFFVEPPQLAYRQFDRQTNPVVAEVVDEHPDLFAGWTQADFDELHSHRGTGGALTIEGTLAVVQHINRNRQLHEKLAVLLETGQAELICRIVEAMYETVVKQDA